MAFSSPLTSLEMDDGFYRAPPVTTWRQHTLKAGKKARDPEPEPLPSPQSSQGPTPSQEARMLAHDDEVNPQKYAIIGDNEYLHRARAKYDAEDTDYHYIPSQQSTTDSVSSGLDARELKDEIRDLGTWNVELNDGLTTRGSSMARSMTDQDTDASSDDEDEDNEDEDNFPKHLDGRKLLDFGCWWLTGSRYGSVGRPALTAKLQEDFDLDRQCFNKVLRFVQDHTKCWGSYIMGDPEFVLAEAKSEWAHLDEPKY